jgi:hypothetical protein
LLFTAPVDVMRLPSLVRAVCAAMTMVAYAMPPATDALAALSHGAYHAAERIAERQARASAFGLVHWQGEPTASRQGTRVTTNRASAGMRAHEHGGSRHAHADPVDALLAAASDPDGEEAPPAPPLVELAGHLPSCSAPFAPGRMPSYGVSTQELVPAGDSSLPPPPPPPRA